MECIRNKCRELFIYSRPLLGYEEEVDEDINDEDFNIKDILQIDK